MDSHYVEYAFSVSNAAAGNSPLAFNIPGVDLGRFNEVEIQADINAPADNGSGATPTLDIKMQSALDGFSNSDMIHDLFTLDRATTAATAQRTVQGVSATGLVLMGRDHRLLFTAGSTAGSYTWTGTVRIFYRYA